MSAMTATFFIREHPELIILTSSSDEDVIILESPAPRKPHKPVHKKRKTHNNVAIIISDSEEENSIINVPDDSPVKQCNKVEKACKLGVIRECKTKISDSKHNDAKLLGVQEVGDVEKTCSKLDKFAVENIDLIDREFSKEAKKKDNDINKNNYKNRLPQESSTSDESCTPYNRCKSYKDCSYINLNQQLHEKRQHSTLLYHRYKNRGGPAHPGSKNLPKGKPDCLKNLCFLRTGVLDSMENEEFAELVKKHGGRTVKAVSRKINYLIVGEDPGPAKLKKAKSYGIPSMSEDEFLNLICSKSDMTLVYAKKDEYDLQMKVKQQNMNVSILNGTNKDLVVADDAMPPPKPLKNCIETTDCKNLKPTEKLSIEMSGLSLLTGKYKPTNTKSIIGQQGDNSCMRKLMTWLKNWNKYYTMNAKAKPQRAKFWLISDNGCNFKCALLSGPPGVGKTTTATLVAKELGFDIVEFNASHIRSKKFLHEKVSQLLSTLMLSAFVKEGLTTTKKRVLLMDEVDAIDSGEMQEFIGLIKNTKIPIICICNERHNQNIRSLINYCFDLRFTKPQLQQIKGAMMSVCYKEGIKVTPETLTQIINECNVDIRQTLNCLSMWIGCEGIISQKSVQKENNLAISGPWEVCKMVFSEEHHKCMSLADKFNLFFRDDNIARFIQENYINVVPHVSKDQVLIRIADAADSISMSDVVSSKIRESNNWLLLDVQAMYASVLPGHYMEGHIVTNRIKYPSCLGMNSSKNKRQMLLSKIRAYSRVSTSCNRVDFDLDYRSYLFKIIVHPLITHGTEGIDMALSVMKSYNLLPEDLNSLSKLSKWRISGTIDLFSKVDSKIKAALKKAYL